MRGQGREKVGEKGREGKRDKRQKERQMCEVWGKNQKKRSRSGVLLNRGQGGEEQSALEMRGAASEAGPPGKCEARSQVS